MNRFERGLGVAPEEHKEEKSESEEAKKTETRNIARKKEGDISDPTESTKSTEDFAASYRRDKFHKRMNEAARQARKKFIEKEIVDGPSGTIGVKSTHTEHTHEKDGEIPKSASELAASYREQRFKEQLEKTKEKIKEGLQSIEVVENSSGAVGIRRKTPEQTQEVLNSEEESSEDAIDQESQEIGRADEGDKTKVEEIKTEAHEKEFKIPHDKRELVKYGREHFGKLGEADLEEFQTSFGEKETADFRRFIEQSVRSLIDSREAEKVGGRYPDNVASVLGSAGSAMGVLVRMMSLKEGRVVKSEEIEKMPFSRLAKELLDIDVEQIDKNYFGHFSHRG